MVHICGDIPYWGGTGSGVRGGGSVMLVGFSAAIYDDPPSEPKLTLSVSKKYPSRVGC